MNQCLSNAGEHRSKKKKRNWKKNMLLIYRIAGNYWEVQFSWMHAIMSVCAHNNIIKHTYFMYLILAVNSWSTAKTEENWIPQKCTIVQSEGNWPGPHDMYVLSCYFIYIPLSLQVLPNGLNTRGILWGWSCQFEEFMAGFITATVILTYSVGSIFTTRELVLVLSVSE